MSDSGCKTRYRGKSYPRFHGTKCVLTAGHDSGPPSPVARHYALVNGLPLSWYTQKQKAVHAAGKTRPPKATP